MLMPNSILDDESIDKIKKEIEKENYRLIAEHF